MSDLEKRLLDNRFASLEGRIYSIEQELIDHCEQHPEISQQWQEARLRALEMQVKELMGCFK